MASFAYLKSFSFQSYSLAKGPKKRIFRTLEYISNEMAWL